MYTRKLPSNHYCLVLLLFVFLFGISMSLLKPEQVLSFCLRTCALIYRGWSQNASPYYSLRGSLREALFWKMLGSASNLLLLSGWYWVCFPCHLLFTELAASEKHSSGLILGTKSFTVNAMAASYTHLTLPTTIGWCRSRWSPYH